MKNRLLTPGPTAVPERVLLAMSKPIIHHRTKKFEEIFAKVQEHLKCLLDEKTPPLIFSSSGTGAFEAAIENFFNKNDKVLCITGGKFGENWLKMALNFGLNAIEVKVKWGDVVNHLDIKNLILEHDDLKAVFLVASETSTGVRMPYEEIGKIIKENSPNCLFIVDAVTAIGVWPIKPSVDNIDVLIFGSQKGLMLPPGLSFLWANEKALDKLNFSNLGKFYFDIAKEKKAQRDHQTAHTPAVSLIIGLLEALEMMKEEGLRNVFLRHERLSMACRKGMQALNLELFSKVPSQAITAVFSPSLLKAEKIIDALENWASYTIAGGQEGLKGKIFRVGHMGYVDELDLIAFMGALEIVLIKLGANNFSPGASMNAMALILATGFN